MSFLLKEGLHSLVSMDPSLLRKELNFDVFCPARNCVLFNDCTRVSGILIFVKRNFIYGDDHKLVIFAQHPHDPSEAVLCVFRVIVAYSESVKSALGLFADLGVLDHHKRLRGVLNEMLHSSSSNRVVTNNSCRN